ncbi:MAG: penicillin acylase family protein [Cyclobacteriaceae bacterium]|nr:penicillin acylase family protein [Cyclobacteriaceae bacterium]
MKFLKFIISTAITISLLYTLNTRLVVSGNPVPPLGKFLDPFCGFWQNAENVEENTAEKLIHINGLTESVEIVFDKNQIPHLFAKNNHDLYMAQGYTIAMMRLWQMEFQTHAAAGRISELIGEKGINFDRAQRRKGMVFGAKNTLHEMYNNKKIGKLIDAYAQGVNSYINQLEYKDFPIEYKLLDYQPEEWTSLKSALILEYMIDNLTGWENDLENTNALQLLGQEKFDFLFPEWLEGIDPVIPSDSIWGFTPLEVSSHEEGFASSLIKEVLPKPDPDNGSNNWAVSGIKTKSGKPILANDTHLGLNLPSLWILMQLQSPDVNVYGYTFTGALGITIGFNENSAWGYTNAPRDTRDWYKITFKDASKTEYWYDSSWVATTKVVEEIKLRGKPSYFDTVTYTHHGPVVYDDTFLSDEKNNFALRWTGHEPSNVQTAIHDLNRAQNYAEYRKAIENWETPSQNIVYANTNGDIALTVQGKYPVKWKGQGKFLMDGSNPDMEWGDYIPMQHNAAQYNPKRNYVSSANQHSVDPQYPYYVYNGGNEAYRNRRINRLLDSMSNVTPQDFMSMHQDAYSIKAEEVLPVFLDSLVTNHEHEDIINALKRWDYQYTATSTTPTLFNRWWKEFMNVLWDEFKNDKMALDRPSDFTTTHIITHFPANEFTDIISTEKKESLTDIINIAFENAVSHLKQWETENGKAYTWGEYKSTSVIHLAKIVPFSNMNIQVNGHDDAINSTKPNHGPSQRFIIEMTTPPKAWGVFPGGQSGNPGSPYYDNFINQWRNGEYMELIYMPTPEDRPEHIKNKITLQSK